MLPIVFVGFPYSLQFTCVSWSWRVSAQCLFAHMLMGDASLYTSSSLEHWQIEQQLSDRDL